MTLRGGADLLLCGPTLVGQCIGAVGKLQRLDLRQQVLAIRAANAQDLAKC